MVGDKNWLQWRDAYNYLNLVVGIFLCLYLLTLPLRKKNSGILLLDVGRVGISKFSFGLGIAIAALQTLGLFSGFLPGTSWEEIGYKALTQYTLALYFIAFGGHLEFRSNGIWSMGYCFKWSRMKSSKWEKNMLVIELEKRRFLSLEIPASHRDAVNHILAEHLPDNYPKVSQQLGLKDGILAVYNQNAATHHVYAEVKGVRSSDRADASGRYFILGTAGSEFVVTDGKGVYKTNEQIITSKVITKVGEAATTQVRTLRFNDEDAVAPIQELKSAYPNAAIYLSGSLTVDFPEEVKLPILPDQYQTVSLSGAAVNLEYLGVEGAIALLKDQYAVGTVTAKIVQPKP